MEFLEGLVSTISYQDLDSGFTVARIQLYTSSDLIAAVGSMPTLREGETLKAKGEWKNHLVHGKQFIVDSYESAPPTSTDAIHKYLSSKHVKGIGPHHAQAIIERFGDQTLSVIDYQPKELLKVEGIGPKRLSGILESWQNQKILRELILLIHPYGIGPITARKIFKRYGTNAVKVLKENPYQLAYDLHGVGFKKADALAQNLNIAPESPQRLQAAIRYTLEELSGQGHTCYPEEELLEQVSKLTDVNISAIREVLHTLELDKKVVKMSLTQGTTTKNHIWLSTLAGCEAGIAHQIKRLQTYKSLLIPIDPNKAIEKVKELTGIEYAKQQEEAIRRSIDTKCLIITGGPGTGKSTITDAILKIYQKRTTKIFLTAPTGRAAKRLSEITNHKASTIHSLLSYNFMSKEFKFNEKNPLDVDLLIIDEASMIDTYLMYHLLKALPHRTTIIFVGDVHQLPSVGPGNVLKDLISSNTLPVVTLDQIFRQAQTSDIIVNAHKIQKGVFPDLKTNKSSDFFFIPRNDKEDVFNEILSLASYRIANRYRFNPMQDIQVLTPMRKGVIGVENLNFNLQKTLNPSKVFLKYRNCNYAVGDKVMQLKNNYQKNIFNGDIGYVLSVDPEAGSLIVDFEDTTVEYDLSDLDELTLAYAVSVHKYQGSECPCIIMPVHTTHYVLLYRNLLYTGVTRGKKLVILVGSKKALAICLNNNESLNRYTGLTQALQSAHEKESFLKS